MRLEFLIDGSGAIRNLADSPQWLDTSANVNRSIYEGAAIIVGANDKATAGHVEAGSVAAFDDGEAITYSCHVRQLAQKLSPSDLAAICGADNVAVPALSKERLAAYAADKRWQVMVAGLTVNGVQIPGDDTATTRLKAARDLLRDNAITEPVTVVIGLAAFSATEAELTAIINALAVRQQAAFAVQGAVVADINAGTITTCEQIDEQSWPA